MRQAHEHGGDIFMAVQVFRRLRDGHAEILVDHPEAGIADVGEARAAAAQRQHQDSGLYPGMPLTIGATMPAAVMMATVAEPCAMRIAAAISQTTSSGEMRE